MKKIETDADLKARKAEFEARIEKLESELIKGWDEELSREINILNHHLRVCEERINNEWFKDEYADNIEQLPFK